MSDETELEKPVRIRTLPPNDPIYTRGFVLGAVGRNSLPSDIQAALLALREAAQRQEKD